MTYRDYPYRQFEDTRQWAVLDRAVSDLVTNKDLEETTAHRYVVGYLCEALAKDMNTTPEAALAGPRKRPPDEMLNIFRSAREAVHEVVPRDRDILAEFSADRQAEAERE